MSKKINQFKMNQNPYPTDIDFKIKQHKMKKDSDYIASTDYSEVRTAAEALNVKEWEVLRVIDILGTNKRTLVYEYFEEEKEGSVGAKNEFTPEEYKLFKEQSEILAKDFSVDSFIDPTESLLRIGFGRGYGYRKSNMRNKQNVLEWAASKDLLKPENRFVQFAKVVSEVGELGDALIKDNHAEIADSIGDSVVTLIILSNQCGLDIEDCLESAYQVIKNRTGRTNGNGTFIKD
jgi:NTP pyrophosphatase (non-canonical NTP hydrolase)